MALARFVCAPITATCYGALAGGVRLEQYLVEFAYGTMLSLDRNLSWDHAHAGLVKIAIGRAEEREAHVSQACAVFVALSLEDPAAFDQAPEGMLASLSRLTPEERSHGTER